MKKITIIALISLIFFSCKEDDVVYPPMLGAATVTITKEAQVVTLPIVSEMEILNVTMDASASQWCTFEWTQDEIVATVAQNRIMPREVTFTLEAEIRNGTATIRQEGRERSDFHLIDKSRWEVEAVSDEIVSDGGGAAAILIDNHSTYWHNDWSSAAPLPHWIVLDMQEEQTVDMVELGWRQYGEKYYYYNKVTEVYMGNSPDPDQITRKVGTLNTPLTDGQNSSSDKYQPFHYLGLEVVPGRYMKIVIPESNNGQNSIIAYVKAYKYEGPN